MKRYLFLFGFLLVLTGEIVATVVFASRASYSAQDTVVVNEIARSVSRDFYALAAHDNETTLDYVVWDDEGNVLFRTKSGLSETLNEAIAHRDTVLDVVVDGDVVGKVVIYNDGERTVAKQKRTLVAVLCAAIAIQSVLYALYALYLHHTVVKPFGKLKGFAERISCGNLDVPLEMDRKNIFGAFTESFDIMRAELKRARIAEAEAQRSKKELVAKLSHDIKTPVASIKAVAEVAQAVTDDAKDRGSYAQIIGKADQINTLVTNLFTATLDELEELSVTPSDISSARVRAIAQNADYLSRADVPPLPDCLVVADALRLQQVFDNIFANSYKYANTPISVDAQLRCDRLYIVFEDYGGGVDDRELPLLKEKFKRGSNSGNIDGAGLGLYISDYFMNEMGGELIVENGEHGLKVTVALALSGAKNASKV